MQANYTIQDLQKMARELSNPFREAQPMLPQPPAKVTATGLKLGYRIQWPQVDGADGYRISMMRTNNFASVEDHMEVSGEQTITATWFYGDVATARQFTVQAYKKMQTGERLYSEPCYPFASATSKVSGGAADTAPSAVQSTPISPAGKEGHGDPRGVRSKA